MPPSLTHDEHKSKNMASVHWFRHGLRLHDNPALLEALKDGNEFYPIFIFDGEVAGIYQIVFDYECQFLNISNFWRRSLIFYLKYMYAWFQSMTSATWTPISFEYFWNCSYFISYNIFIIVKAITFLSIVQPTSLKKKCSK